MKKIILASLILTVLQFAHAIAPLPSTSAKLLSTSKQLLVVSTADWNAATGQLQRFKRDSLKSAWHPVGKAIPVVLGKNGTAWGNEYRTVYPTRIKKEGDGKTPVGIYPIGKTFGFAEKSKTMNYFPLTTTSICVDDANSIYYNQLIDSSRAAKIDWHSGEKMREVPQYEIGAMILYNTPPAQNAGSCIFLHIWKNQNAGTAGCIAMEKTNLTEILNWLDAKQKPMIAVLPIHTDKAT